MKRTPEEIRLSIYAACGGDFTDVNAKIADLQSKLALAITWEECSPDGGWYATAHRQIAALRALPAESNEGAEDDLLAFFYPREESPVKICHQITEKMSDGIPWDVKWVDDYIARRTKSE